MQRTNPSVVIACGGTGGHVFPGIAVLRALQARGVGVTLIVSEKQVDRDAVAGLENVAVDTIPSVGFGLRTLPRFVITLIRSTSSLIGAFRRNRPSAVLSMGGFTSAAPILAAFFLRVPVVIHEANSIPGRANRLLSRLARTVLLHFDESRSRFRHRDLRVVGMPVRREFEPRRAQTTNGAREALGFDPERPLLVVIGGSQGAGPVNRLVAESLGVMSRELPGIQVLHVAGTRDLGWVRERYQAFRDGARVEGFFSDMPTALSAASVVLSRAGASSLAEISRVGVPSVLIPFPRAADNHQLHNARAFVPTHRATLLEQSHATPETLVKQIRQHLSADHGVLDSGSGVAADPAVAVADAVLSLPEFPQTDNPRQPSKPGRYVRSPTV